MSSSIRKAKVDREKLPPGGIEGLLLLVDRADAEGQPDVRRLRDTTDRDFDIVGTLTKFLVLTKGITAGVGGSMGESFFRSQKGAEIG